MVSCNKYFFLEWRACECKVSIQYFSNPHLTVVKYFILRSIPYTIAGEVWAVSVVCSQRPVSDGSVWWKSVNNWKYKLHRLAGPNCTWLNKKAMHWLSTKAFQQLLFWVSAQSIYFTTNWWPCCALHVRLSGFTKQSYQFGVRWFLSVEFHRSALLGIGLSFSLKLWLLFHLHVLSSCPVVKRWVHLTHFWRLQHLLPLSAHKTDVDQSCKGPAPLWSHSTPFQRCWDDNEIEIVDSHPLKILWAAEIKLEIQYSMASSWHIPVIYQGWREWKSM